MHPIPTALRAEMAWDPYYRSCARRTALHDHICGPNPNTGQLIEWEHALIFGGTQVQERWAIVPLCWHTHQGPGKKKEINVWLALNRASDEELRKYSKGEDLIKKREYLNKKYGTQRIHLEHGA